MKAMVLLAFHAVVLWNSHYLLPANVLLVLDYCDVVWHECGQGNSEEIERLQRRAARIVFFKDARKLSTDQILTNRQGWKPLYFRRRTHILRFVNECISNRVPRYLLNYFNVRNHDIHHYKTRTNDLNFGKS